MLGQFLSRPAVLVTAIACLSGTARAQSVYHVDRNSTAPHHDGRSWCTAFQTLDEALAAAAARGGPVEIHVADGSYSAAGSDVVRTPLFPANRGIAILGGYAGCGGEAEDRRDPAQFESHLNFVVEESGVGYFFDATDNSFHMVHEQLQTESVLKGFVLPVLTPGTLADKCAFLRSPEAGNKSVVFPHDVYVACGLAAPVAGGAAQVPHGHQAPNGLGSWDQAVDVRVNNPGADAHPSETQNETTIAANDDAICVAYNDSGSAPGFTGFARSVNGGAAFTDQGSLGASSGDPCLTVDADDDFALSHMIDTADAGGFVPDQIAVAFSQDDCASFSLTHFARLDADIDKPWVAVDRTGGPNHGNVYVCWTEFVSGIPSIMFRRGIPFTNPVVTIKTGAANNLVQGCQVAVGKDGEVFVAWEERAAIANPGAASIRIRKSVNGGAAFAAEKTVGTLTDRADDPAAAVANCGFFGGALGPAANPIRIQDFPSMATNPQNNDVYVVWNERIGGDVDVVFHRSVDDGDTWAFTTFPHSIVGRDQFEPAVTVAANGVIKVQWYDRRNDANNTKIELFAAVSPNRGTTFTDAVVSDVAFDLDAFSPAAAGGGAGAATCYMGEYNHLTAHGDEFFHVWGDNRDTPGAGHGGAGQPAQHLDPNVYFDKQDVPEAVTIPTLSLWAVTILTLLVLTAGSIVFHRRFASATVP